MVTPESPCHAKVWILARPMIAKMHGIWRQKSHIPSNSYLISPHKQLPFVVIVPVQPSLCKDGSRTCLWDASTGTQFESDKK